MDAISNQGLPSLLIYSKSTEGLLNIKGIYEMVFKNSLKISVYICNYLNQ